MTLPTGVMSDDCTCHKKHLYRDISRRHISLSYGFTINYFIVWFMKSPEKSEKCTKLYLTAQIEVFKLIARKNIEAKSAANSHNRKL